MAGNRPNSWDRLASEIEAAVEDAYRRFVSLSEETVRVRPQPSECPLREDHWGPIGNILTTLLESLRENLIPPDTNI